MYLDLVIGEFKLNITLTCGNLFKRFKRKKSADTYEATIADAYADTSAETYEEEIINFYDVKKVNKIQAQADKFSNELEEFMSDVEVIDDAYENAMQDKLERVRGY